MGKIGAHHFVLGAALLLAGCSAPPALTPETSPTATTAAVAKPVAMAGKPLGAITAADVSLEAGYQDETGSTDAVARDAAQLGLDVLKVFTSDYAKYQKISEGLNQEELLALLPDVQKKLAPLINEGALANLSEKWQKEASDPTDLDNSLLMLVTDSGESPEDHQWKNNASLDCGISDAEWTVTFSDPRIEAVAQEGAEYKATAFKAKAHYLLPCAEGNVLGQEMDWQLDLGASPDNTRWQVYRWSRTPLGNAGYVPGLAK